MIDRFISALEIISYCFKIFQGVKLKNQWYILVGWGRERRYRGPVKINQKMDSEGGGTDFVFPAPMEPFTRSATENFNLAW